MHAKAQSLEQGSPVLVTKESQKGRARENGIRGSPRLVVIQTMLSSFEFARHRICAVVSTL